MDVSKGKSFHDDGFSVEKSLDPFHSYAPTVRIHTQLKIIIIIYARLGYLVATVLQRHISATDVMNLKWPNDILLNNRKV